MIGSVVGNYRIVERLGDGGMGAVFRAVDEMLDREVAIKVLKPELARNAQLIERFRQEAVALARLNHPRIATLHGLERHGDSLLMIMEYVRGDTIEAIVQRSGRIAWPRACELCAAVLDALDHAHDKGVVHRDIKPANVMLSSSGAVKVMDFGIARLVGRSRQTQVGHAVGTPTYMAPEQLRGEEVDGRTDLYAVGAVLFELVTGRMAFEADSDYALMMKQLDEPPPAASRFVPEVPAALDLVIGRAMAKRRDDRYPNAVAFREVLEELASVSVVRPRRTPLPAETRLAASLPVADAGVGSTASPPSDPGAPAVSWGGAPSPARDSAPSGQVTPPGATRLSPEIVQATAEHGLRGGGAGGGDRMAEVRLVPPAAGRSAVPPAAHVLETVLSPAAIGAAPSSAGNMSRGRRGEWVHDWRTYAIAGALFLSAGLVARTWRAPDGPVGNETADTATVATLGGTIPAASDTAVAGSASPTESAKDLRLESPGASGVTGGGAPGGAGSGAGDGTGSGGTGRGRQRPAPPRGERPAPPREGGDAPDRPSDRGVVPAPPPDQGQTVVDPAPVRSDPQRPPPSESEDEEAAQGAIRDALSSAASLLSGSSTGAAESLLEGSVAASWIALMREGRVSMSVSGAPAVTLRGARASAEFDASVNVRSPFGANRRRPARFSAELQRSGGVWRVTSLRALGGVELK
jgi:serine/threonine protein kinase